jgi:hypothetical protein
MNELEGRVSEPVREVRINACCSQEIEPLSS